MRVLSALAAVLTVEILAGSAPAAPPPRQVRTDFSGTWKLNESLSSDAAALMRRDGLLPDGGAGPGGTPGEGGGRRGGRGSPATGGGIDYPFQLLEDERRLAVADDGETLKITRSRGRKRVIFTDGEERELDDGDGPAKVTARRKGASGERIVVASSWSTGRKVDETWELGAAPRRLTVTTKVSARASFTIKRVYDPAPDLPEPEATATPRAQSGTVPSAAEAPPQTASSAAPSPASASTSPAGMASCSVRLPRGTRQETLSRLAKVSQADAHSRAVAFVAPRRPSSVISSDVENYEGCLVWTFLLRFEGEAGVQELVVDAGDGRVLSAEKDPR